MPPGLDGAHPRKRVLTQRRLCDGVLVAGHNQRPAVRLLQNGIEGAAQSPGARVHVLRSCSLRRGSQQLCSHPADAAVLQLSQGNFEVGIPAVCDAASIVGGRANGNGLLDPAAKAGVILYLRSQETACP